MGEVHNVVIIGAGPAGLACARQLMNTDFKVFIIDHKEEPWSKLCAGGVRINDLENIGLMPDKVNGCDILLSEDDGQMVEFTTIDRKLLGKWQLKLIDKAENISLKFGWKMIDLTADHVYIRNGKNNQDIKFDYLVGADGSLSNVRKKLGVPIRKECMLNLIQGNFPLNKDLNQYDTLTFFYDRALFGDWYGYIFPNRRLNLAKVGCVTGIPWLKENDFNIRALMMEWLKTINLDSNGIALKVAFINADYQGYDYTESNLGKVFLCGDAAGFAFYLSGEGIHQALVSGSETGKMILNKNYIPEQLNEIIDRKQHEIIGQRLNHEKGKWSRMSRFLHRLIKP